MCAKRYKLAQSLSVQRIRKARQFFRKMTNLERIDAMVVSGLMTKKEGEEARKKLAESSSE